MSTMPSLQTEATVLPSLHLVHHVQHEHMLNILYCDRHGVAAVLARLLCSACCCCQSIWAHVEGRQQLSDRKCPCNAAILTAICVC